VKDIMKRLLKPSAFKAGLLVVLVALLYYFEGSQYSGEKLPLLDSLDDRVTDFMFQIRGERPTTDSVVILDIDEASLKALGQWPWARSQVAALTVNADRAGAKIIGFDIVFAEPDRLSLSAHEEYLKKKGYLTDDVSLANEDNDVFFGEAILDAEAKAILGYFMKMEDDGLRGSSPPPLPEFSMELAKLREDLGGGWECPIPVAYRPILNLQTIADGAMSEGFYNAIPDSSGIVRNVPLLMRYRDTIYPHLTLEMVREVRAEEGMTDTPTLAVSKSGLQGIHFDGKLIPTDLECKLLVNYRGNQGAFPYISAADVIAGKPEALAQLKDKYALIGTSTWGLRDLRATPFAQSFPGVEILATVIDNILANDPLRLDILTERGVIATILVVGGIGLTILLTYSGALVGGAAGFALMAFLVIGNYYGFFLRNQIVGITYPLFTLVTIYLVVSVLNYFFEGREKRIIRGMFSTMVSGDVLRYMEDNPGSFSLAGEERQATMFFSDVAGFTTISESLTPQDLVLLLNAYLTPMTEIVMGHQGYVDKYEGDAIMAEWGVPYPLEEHARLACFAALDQQEKLTEMREDLYQRFGHRLFVRMGLNSGTVSAGNMGSTDRFSYTVMGDAVNQAARFEPANKDYDTDIMMGASTYELAKPYIEARMLDKIIVKGKTEPIDIYELIAKRGKLSTDQAEIIGLYEEALKVHWERDFEGALKKLNEGLRIIPDDGPCNALLERIKRYTVTPPPDTWQGEYVRTSKD
jgi:adenylate cyclase